MFTYCLSLTLFVGTPMARTTPVQCLQLKAFEIAAEYKLDPYLFSAIIEHESRWKVGAYNSKTRDYGLGQVNIKNIKRLNLDPQRLLYDPEYNLRISAATLAYMHKRFRTEIRWYCRYNVGTRKHLSAALNTKCQTYYAKINRNLNNNNVARKD